MKTKNVIQLHKYEDSHSVIKWEHQASRQMQVEQCRHVDMGTISGVMVLQLIHFLCEQSYLHKKSAVSGLAEWIKWGKKTWWHTKRNTWCECDVQRNATFWGKWRGRQGYPPGGGETSREISGRGRTPLLSGATLSEHVTNIVVDGTAAFHKHKASASAMPLSVLHSNIHIKITRKQI